VRPTIVAVLVATLSAVAVSPAVAQFGTMDMPVICGPTDALINKVMTEPFDEAPVAKWAGSDNVLTGLMTVNGSTGTMTVFLIRDEVACMITSGFNTRMIAPLANPKRKPSIDN